MKAFPYSVRITYSESIHGEIRTFTHDIVVTAASFDDAKRRATDQFHETARESKVSWPRSIISMQVKYVGPGSKERIAGKEG